MSLHVTPIDWAVIAAGIGAILGISWYFRGDGPTPPRNTTK